MKKTKNEIIEEALPGIENMDRAWMTDFWEVFTDCVIGTDARFLITNIRRKPDSTFNITGILGKPFAGIAVDKDQALVAEELELLKTTDTSHRRFSFLARNERYYRFTLIALRENGEFSGIRGVAVDITEQTLKETTLNWQRAIIEGSSDFISIADLGGHELYTNPGAYKMTGYDPGQGTLFPELIYTPEHLKAVKGEGTEIAAGSGSWTGLGELVCADGKILPIEHNIFSIKNNLDEAILIATTIRDITDFVEHEKTIRNEQRRAELLASVAMGFSLSDDFDASVNGALTAIGSYMNLDAIFIYRDQKEQQRFIRDYIWTSNALYGIQPGKEVPSVDQNTGEHTREYTLLQNMPVIVVDDMSSLDSDLFVKVRQAGIKSMICLPIHADDRFWGFICLNMYKENRKWLDRDIRFLTTVCGILSTSLEKRLMSKKWQTAQADLQAVLDNVPTAIYWKDSRMNYRGANKRFLDFYGLKEKDIIGKRSGDIPAQSNIQHMDERDMQLIESGTDALHETELAVAASGNLRWINKSRVLMRDETGTVASLLGVFEDITESRETEQRAAQALSQLKAVVGNYPGIIWSVDPGRRFTLYDGTFPAASGEALSGIVGQNMHEYAKKHPGSLHPSILDKVELTFNGEPQNWMMELQNAVFRCNTMPILDAAGGIAGVVGASVDVTSLIQMQRDLEEARKAAEAANAAKSEFLSRMSHEIRTPMNAIIGMTHIAKSSGNEDRIRNCLEKIDNASKHLLALINDILDISKIEANKLELNNEAFDLRDCINNIRNIITVRADEKKLSFGLSFSESLPQYLIGDELRFTQVIINLLGNAIKFTPENGSLSLSLENLGEDNGDCVIEVRVKDSGIGIAPEHQDKLFLPFEQGDGGITREFGGTGLGLAISKYIVELMNGKIWVESAAGKGSVFAFTVKMSMGDESAAVGRTAEKRAAYTGDIKDLRVLAVDSSEEELDYMINVLRAFSINCARAGSGSEAVIAASEAAERGEPFDIVFVDGHISDTGALGAAGKVLEISPGSAVFMIVPDSEWLAVETEARDYGITQHLDKPFTPSALLESIHDLTGFRYKKSVGESGAPEYNDLSKFTLLLVEDVEINKEIVCAVLEGTNINIDYAENGAKAVEMFAASPDKYDIILMDMQMPVMDGLEATRRIRALETPRARDIMIVAMTANVFKEDVDRCKAAGMNDHIAKPIDTALLLEKLNDYLLINEYLRAGDDGRS